MIAWGTMVDLVQLVPADQARLGRMRPGAIPNASAEPPDWMLAGEDPPEVDWSTPATDPNTDHLPITFPYPPMRFEDAARLKGAPPLGPTTVIRSRA